MSMDQRAALRVAATHTIRLAVEVIDIIYNAAGTTAIYDAHFIQRAFQDIHVISQHTQGAPRDSTSWSGATGWACPSTPRSFKRDARHLGGRACPMSDRGVPRPYLSPRVLAPVPRPEAPVLGGAQAGDDLPYAGHAFLHRQRGAAPAHVCTYPAGGA